MKNDRLNRRGRYPPGGHGLGRHQRDRIDADDLEPESSVSTDRVASYDRYPETVEAEYRSAAAYARWEAAKPKFGRIKAAGFELVELRNSWNGEEYKGINSRWLVPENGQLFEVQFHTQISFEAKQLTHPAYERLRIEATSKAERDELEAFQRRVDAYVPTPRGALIYGLSVGGHDADEDRLLRDR